MSFRIKKGDRVVVTAGRGKGKEGEVLGLLLSKNKVLVAGANVMKKTVKRSAEQPSGAIVDKELPIHMSNVMHIDPKDGSPCRIGYKRLEDGSKVRYSKKSGELIK